MIRSKLSAMVLFLLLGFGSLATGNEVADVEIEYLLKSVGHSGCVFVRNGSEHSSEDAESHLRLKYRNGKKHAKTTEQFIERLASKSSWTNKAYYLRCEAEGRQRVGEWLAGQIAAYRQSSLSAGIDSEIPR